MYNLNNKTVTGEIMNFLKKLFAIESSDEGYIGLSSFTNNSHCLEDKREEPKKHAKKEPSLTELLKRAN